MKITSPITCSTDFGPVEFEQCEQRPDGVFAVTVAGEEVAELAPMTVFGPEMLLTDDYSVEPPAHVHGSWSLTLTGPADDALDTHLLFLAGAHTDGSDLTGELAVWATLAMIWAREASDISRG